MQQVEVRGADAEARTERADRVRDVFGQTTSYLSRRYRLNWRREVVAHFVKDRPLGRVADIGCGDGSLSLPLLDRCSQLTLVDNSETMLDSVRKCLPEGSASKVQLLNSDVEALDLAAASYDVVLCIGLLAHVDNPDKTLEQVAGLVRPGGLLILEHTDLSHPLGWLLVQYSRARSLIQPNRYPWNALRSKQILERCARLGLELTAEYRYGLPLRIDRVLSDQQMYDLGRSIFGDVAHNRNRWLGCERMYRLERP